MAGRKRSAGRPAFFFPFYLCCGFNLWPQLWWQRSAAEADWTLIIHAGLQCSIFKVLLVCFSRAKSFSYILTIIFKQIFLNVSSVKQQQLWWLLETKRGEKSRWFLFSESLWRQNCQIILGRFYMKSKICVLFVKKKKEDSSLLFQNKSPWNGAVCISSLVPATVTVMSLWDIIFFT